MKKRLLSILLVLCLALTLLPTAALANEGEPQEPTDTENMQTGNETEIPGEDPDVDPAGDPATPVPDVPEGPAEDQVPPAPEDAPETPVEDSTAPETVPAPANEVLGDTPAPVDTTYVARIGEKQYETLAAAITAATDGQTITLLADVEETLSIPSVNLTLDLGGHKLTMKNARTLTLEGEKSLTIQNGSIESKSVTLGNTANFEILTKASITLDHVHVDTTATFLYPRGDAARVTVKDSEIKCGVYAVGTNAGDPENKGVVITLTNSTFTSTYGYQNSDGDSCPVMINVPGTLNMDGCTVNGTRQGVVVRGGDATIKNSTIKLTDSPYAGSDATKYDSANWGSGNNVPMAALLVGNRSNSYPYPATCTLENTTVTAPTGYKTVYLYGMDDVSRKVTFSYDDTSKLGTVVCEGKAVVANVEAGGKVYATVAEALATDATTIKLLHDIEITKPIDIQNKTVTLDLGGKTLKSSGIVLKTHQATVVVQNGNILSNKGGYGIAVGQGTKLTVEANATLSGGYAIAIADFLKTDGETTATSGKGTEVHLHGQAIGYDPSEYGAIGIGINGNLNSLEDFAKIHIYSGARVEGAHGTSANINYADGAAIYAAGYAEWIIDEGATITGDEALSIKAGKFTINGGTFTASGPYSDPATSWSNGTEATGAAISVTTNKSYAQNVEMTIKGGTFTSEKGIAFYESGTQDDGNTDSAFKNKGASITGGSFKGKESAVHSQHLNAFISGGYFSSDPSAYLADGKSVLGSDKTGYAYMVGDKPIESEVDVVVEPPEADVNAPEGTSEEVVTAVSGIAASPAQLAEAANATVQSLSDAEVNSAVAALDKVVTGEVKAEDVTLVVKPVIAVEITAYDAAAKTMTLDITPKCLIAATTDKDDVQLDGESPNAVLVREEPLNLNGKSVTVTIPLPTGFTEVEKLTVKHVKGTGKVYYYEAVVTTDDQSKKIASFTVSNGFSAFTIQPADTRKLTVNFDSDVGSKTYSITDVGTSLPNASKSGYTFDGWKISGTTYTELADALWTAVMSGVSDGATKTVTAEAQFTKTSGGSSSGSGGGGGGSSSSGFTVSLPSKTTGGKVTANFKNASEGTVVTLTVKADDGYVLDELTVTDKNGKELKLKTLSGGKYSFTMPKGKVEVEASFVKGEQEGLPFSDVAETYWAYEQIAWAYENGYMNGNSASTFNPSGAVSRQQLWMILARLNGADPADFAAAKTWAVNSNVSDGSQPGGSVTRQQLVTILYRYAQLQGYDVSAAADLAAYPDSASVAGYAQSAMAWAVETGIVGGTAQGTLDPAGTATRAQFAVILSRFCETAGI